MKTVTNGDMYDQKFVLADVGDAILSAKEWAVVVYLQRCIYDARKNHLATHSREVPAGMYKEGDKWHGDGHETNFGTD